MIDILTDVLLYGGGIGSALVYDTFRRLRKAKKRTEPKEPDSIKWAWAQGYTCYGFKCPVCENTVKNTKQMPHCSCEEFARDHFHYVCGDCAYKAIMRAANDPADVKPKSKKEKWFKWI